MRVFRYNLVRACTKPPPVKLYKKSNEEVKTVTKTFLKVSGGGALLYPCQFNVLVGSVA